MCARLENAGSLTDPPYRQPRRTKKAVGKYMAQRRLTDPERRRVRRFMGHHPISAQIIESTRGLVGRFNGLIAKLLN